MACEHAGVPFSAPQRFAGEVRARDTGLLGWHQSIDSKRFKAAKKILAIRSVRIGFGSGGRWGWALPSPESSVDLVIEAPTSIVYDEDDSQPDQYSHDTAAGANDQPDPAPSEWIRGVARLDYGRAPHGVPLHRWRQLVNDCHEFMNAPDAADAVDEAIAMAAPVTSAPKRLIGRTGMDRLQSLVQPLVAASTLRVHGVQERMLD